MPAKAYENQLKKIGFSEKESRVYLACLELGSATVQKIAEKAGVKRATTYVMIESLIDRGLMSTFEKGKKSFFSAVSPKRILGLLEEESDSVMARKEILKEILPDLLLFSDLSKDHPKISFFEGPEGLKTIHEDVLRTTDKTLENIVSLDDAAKVESPEADLASFRDKLLKKGVKVRVLYTSKEIELNLPEEAKKKWSFQKLPHDKFNLHGEITLYGNKVAAFSYRGKILGAIIESAEITQTVRVLFDLAWQNNK